MWNRGLVKKCWYSNKSLSYIRVSIGSYKIFICSNLSKVPRLFESYSALPWRETSLTPMEK